MEIFLKNNDYKYAVEQIMLMLFPGEKPIYPEKPSGALSAFVSLGRGGSYETAFCRITRNGEGFTGMARARISDFTDEIVAERLRQRAIKLAFYRAGVKALGKKPVWGALSGIRPGKLMSDIIEEGTDGESAVRRFMKLYDADRSRALLCLDTAHFGLKMQSELSGRDICLYLGIPFCPTRCAYCSFVSQTVEKSMKLIPPFLEALWADIEATADAVRKAGLRVISVYFGGGTPTTLSPGQLDEVCRRLYGSFDLSACREFTVEAGRPDTITPEKLDVLKKWGVGRVSVNPQTMSDEVLSLIGRRHTAQDVVEALEKVRAAGSFDVNMDLIAGLPGDTAESFAATLCRVLALEPENITVHTLALKKGSRITLSHTEIPGAETVGEMLDGAEAALRAAGYVPYYLYRQKYMSGGFENVGWCRPGRENIYNICIMEELCSIIALGAGASTKLVSQTGRIERFFAPKYPQEYISGMDRVVSDKQKIIEFYNSLSKEDEA